MFRLDVGIDQRFFLESVVVKGEPFAPVEFHKFMCWEMSASACTCLD